MLPAAASGRWPQLALDIHAPADLQVLHLRYEHRAPVPAARQRAVHLLRRPGLVDERRLREARRVHISDRRLLAQRAASGWTLDLQRQTGRVPQPTRLLHALREDEHRLLDMRFVQRRLVRLASAHGAQDDAVSSSFSAALAASLAAPLAAAADAASSGAPSVASSVAASIASAGAHHHLRRVRLPWAESGACNVPAVRLHDSRAHPHRHHCPRAVHRTELAAFDVDQVCSRKGRHPASRLRVCRRRPDGEHQPVRPRRESRQPSDRLRRTEHQPSQRPILENAGHMFKDPAKCDARRSSKQRRRVHKALPVSCTDDHHAGL